MLTFHDHSTHGQHLRRRDFLRIGGLGLGGLSLSDMLAVPDPATAVMDPFMEHPTLVLICSVIDPITKESYSRDPRNIATKALNYMKSTGVGDMTYFGPEPEFFVFDSVNWAIDMSGSFSKIISSEAAWSTDTEGHIGHHPTVKGGYFPVPDRKSTRLNSSHRT